MYRNPSMQHLLILILNQRQTVCLSMLMERSIYNDLGLI
nr:MAG TPA: hypothetical protein [Bacteriophage sp.]DAI57739.1 MAG TPA: hypothetical protein [Caudoviricetes sp.]